MTRVVAIILHAVPGANGGPLATAFAAIRAANAERLARGLDASGASVTVEAVRPGAGSFGARLRAAAADAPGAGIVVVGSGGVPLASAADLAAFVAAAATDGPVLANNRYSADLVAIPGPISRRHLRDLPDLASDNGLPRWLAERGVAVRDLAARWRLQVDLDSPLDAFLAGLAPGVDGRGTRVTDGARADDPLRRVRSAAARLREVSRDAAAELVVAGRTSATTLRWLEGTTASRTRALVEERGMRTARPGQRRPRSILGSGLDRDGPVALGSVLEGLGDGAIVDSRVLLAHRHGAGEAAWPVAEDRFASDLLLHEAIADPWLGELTRSAASASIPILLGGHTLVGPGARLLFAARPRFGRPR
ncbi:MAG: hypothetical protein HY264_00385 [Chloroflexi bacterium]|nr:hypothetical protein [Chloroflexota bacterium]